MENVCRLCASVKPPDEMIYSIEDHYLNIEQKLIDCCRWKLFDGYEYGCLPRQFCTICFEKLEACWEFCESVAHAQEQILLHMVEIKPEILVDIDTPDTVLLNENPFSDQNTAQFSASSCLPNDVQEAIEDVNTLAQPTGPIADVQNDYNELVHPDDDDCEFILDDDKKIIFAETMPEHIHQSINFMELLSEEDKNADGTVNLDKIVQLNLDTWSAVQSKCFVCKGIFANHRSFISHFEQKHPNMALRYMCTICNSRFCKRRGVFRHVIAKHRPYLEYCCKKCNIYFWDLNVLKKHINGPHKSGFESELILCEICGRSFSNKFKLQSHTRMHLPADQKRTFECFMCKTVFAYKNSLKHHMATHSGDKILYQCGICFANFSRPDAVRRHALIHSGQTPHQCVICGKGFRTKFNLKVHGRMHTGERPYACSYCEYRATDGPNLGKHVKQRHRNEPNLQHSILRSINSS